MAHYRVSAEHRLKLHREADRRWQKRHGAEYLQKIRKLALDAYGGRCVCCGETELKFLAFDHKHGRGGAFRRSSHNKSTGSWYYRLIREHPADIQILCHNCNLAKGFYGKCPHEG